MAGSLNHIIDENGVFTMDFIDNLGDAHEALEECFGIISYLTMHKPELLSEVCKLHGYTDPYEEEEGESTKPFMRWEVGDNHSPYF